jgi:hypothetical protein
MHRVPILAEETPHSQKQVRTCIMAELVQTAKQLCFSSISRQITARNILHFRTRRENQYLPLQIKASGTQGSASQPLVNA